MNEAILRDHVAEASELEQRLRELSALQQAGRILHDAGKSADEWLAAVVELIPCACIQPELVAARIRVSDRAFTTPGFRSTPWHRTVEFWAGANESGLLEVIYRDAPRSDDALDRATTLLDSFADVLTSALEARQAADALQRKQADLEWLINSIDGIVWEARPNSFEFSFVSRQAERLLGYPLAAWYGPTFWIDHLHVDDRDWVPNYCLTEVLAGRPHNFEYRMIAADGRVVWLYDSVSLTTEPPIKVHGVMIDITARKHADAALRASYTQVHQLAANLITAKETERTRIARELHDGINQQLVATSIGLGILQPRVDPEQQDEVRRLGSVLEQAIDTVRNLSHELHPAVLRHSGLIAALTSHCNEFRRQHNLEVELDVDGVDEIRGEAAVGLFRVAQEAIRNVAKHAHANRVRIAVARVDRHIELVIEDDGRGFDATKVRLASGLGLISIQERVRMLRGSSEINSQKGAGTRLHVRVPADLAYGPHLTGHSDPGLSSAR